MTETSSCSLPLTHSQERFLELQQQDLMGGLASEISLALELSPPLSPHKLRHSVEGLYVRHAALRAVFDPVSKSQSITSRSRVTFAEIDLAGADEISSKLRDLSAKPLGKDSGSELVRFTLLTDRTNNLQWLHFQAQHIAIDGVGVALLFEDLGRLANDDLPIDAVSMEQSGAEFSESIAMAIQSDINADRALVDHIAQSIMRSGFPKVEHQLQRGAAPASFAGRRLRVSIEGRSWKEFRSAISAMKLSLFQGLALCYAQALSQSIPLDQANAVHLLVPVTGRDHKANQKMVGNFVNLAPLSLRPFRSLTSIATLKEAFQSNRDELVGFYTRRQVSFQLIKERLHSLGANDVGFVSTFNLEPSFTSARIMDSKVMWYPMDVHTSEFPLMCNVIAEKDRAWFEIDYQTSAFRSETIMAVLNALSSIISSVGRD